MATAIVTAKVSEGRVDRCDRRTWSSVSSGKQMLANSLNSMLPSPEMSIDDHILRNDAFERGSLSSRVQNLKNSLAYAARAVLCVFIMGQQMSLRPRLHWRLLYC